MKYPSGEIFGTIFVVKMTEHEMGQELVFFFVYKYYYTYCVKSYCKIYYNLFIEQIF